LPSAPGTRDLEPATRHRWEPALRGLRADALDCLQTTLALIADDAHGAGTHLALGGRWRFPVRRRDGSVRVQPSLQDRLDEAVELLGLRIAAPQGPMDGPTLRRHLDSTGVLYVVADAHDLPWVPYVGHRHMPHSFLLEAGPAGCTVVDAYHNDTQWGPARPGAWTLRADGIDRAVRDGALAVTVEPGAPEPPADRAAVLSANAARAQAAAGDIERYAAGFRDELDRPQTAERLVLDVWLLARERLLHRSWLGDHPAAADVDGRVEAWTRLATQSYLALRRVERGSRLSGTVVDDLAAALHADAELVARLEAPADGGDVVERAVLDALRATLPLDDRAIREAGTLRALDGFNSFKLVDVIDRVERRLGVELPAEVAADDLQDVAGLCRLFTRAMAVRAG
jgi:acyl carrier protein